MMYMKEDNQGLNYFKRDNKYLGLVVSVKRNLGVGSDSWKLLPVLIILIWFSTQEITPYLCNKH